MDELHKTGAKLFVQLTAGFWTFHGVKRYHGEMQHKQGVGHLDEASF